MYRMRPRIVADRARIICTDKKNGSEHRCFGRIQESMVAPHAIFAWTIAQGCFQRNQYLNILRLPSLCDQPCYSLVRNSLEFISTYFGQFRHRNIPAFCHSAVLNCLFFFSLLLWRASLCISLPLHAGEPYNSHTHEPIFCVVLQKRTAMVMMAHMVLRPQHLCTHPIFWNEMALPPPLHHLIPRTEAAILPLTTF